MCGIVGFIGDGSLNDLESMTDVLAHRGPNDRGLFWNEGVGLGHRRLSIIDLTSGGHQPMFSKDKKISVVFNGEIYNFKDLKEELIKEGVFFESQSDTEVIIELYQKFGEDCFRKMNGMFSIAIYDFEKRRLVLSRDRLGKKPLYWAQFEGTLMFASELKALLKHPFFKKEVDEISLELYLANDYVPTPRTIFKNVYKLEPAHFLIYEGGTIRNQEFWKLETSQKPLVFSRALSQLEDNIKRSVERRMVSDVPIGVFLSGGLDSSAVAYYAQELSKEKIHTFSIGFSEKSFDESKYAKQVSDFLATDHHHFNVSAEDSLEIVSKIPEIFDEPVADASVMPTYLLSKFTKEKVTVALGGDGGDELFAGYPTFSAHKWANAYSVLPNFLKKLISGLIGVLPVDERNFGLSFKLKKFVSGVDSDKFFMHQNWLGTFNSNSRKKLLQHAMPEDVNQSFSNSVNSQVTGADESNSLLRAYMRTYMMDEVLVKVDRASMACSLETRSPFLDYELVEFVNKLPYSYKMHNFTTKYILKKLMRGRLPENIINRSKKGFGVPVAKWLKNELKPLCLELLGEEALTKQGIFKSDFVKKLLDDHFQNKSDNRKEIWNLLVFQLWFNKYMKN